MSLWFNQSRKGSTDNISIFSETARKLSYLENQFLASTEYATDEKKLRAKTSKEFVIYQDCGFGFSNVQQFDLPLTIMREPDADKLKVWLKLDHRNNQIYDKSTFGNHANLSGNPKITIARNYNNPRSSIRFLENTSQENARITIPHSTTLDAFQKLTFSFWIYPEATHAVNKKIILSKGYTKSTDSLANGGFVLYLLDNAITFKIKSNAGNQTSLSTPSTIQLNLWINLIIKLTSTQLVIALNGTETAINFTGSETNPTFTNSSDLYLGGIDADFEGYLDDLILWRHALTTEEIQDYFDFGLFPFQKEITSVWNFDDADFSADSRILDTWGYNDALIENSLYFEFSTTQLKPRLNISLDDQVSTNTDVYLIDEIYNDAQTANRRIGYIFDDDAYLRIPERNEDLRIQGRADQLFHFHFIMISRDFSISQRGRVKQILFYKIDEPDLSYFYMAQIDSSGRIYISVKYNNVLRQYRSVKGLKPNYFYQLDIGLNIQEIINYNKAISEQVRFFINGRQEAVVSWAETLDSNLFTNTNTNGEIQDFDFLIGSTNEGLVGKQKNEIFEFRCYNEFPVFETVNGLWTTKITTRNIPRGRVLRINESKIYESLPKVREFVRGEKEGYTLMDTWTGEMIGDQIGSYGLTGTWNLQSTFSGTLTTAGEINPSIYSVHFSGDNDHIDIPKISIQKKFTAMIWVKYVSKDDGNWAGAFTNLDGLRNGNRLLLNGNQIRWHGQFYNDHEKWNDYKVTVPNYQNEWHMFGVRYDGEYRKKFEILFDGVSVASYHRGGSVQSGDSEVWVGKGERRGNYLVGYVDDFFIFSDWLDDNEIQKLFRHEMITTNQRAIFLFERNAHDTNSSRPRRYDGELRHGAEFSTDVPQ